ncbi:MAG: hypothetical protein C0616_14735 [Desulfuromonas sp.]|nr:MAG: hypothetical protein C0616_14735 [Desulfuromonas sp.]
MAEVVRQVSERLAARGYDVTVAARREGDLERQETHRGVKISRFSVTGNWARGMSGEIDSYRDFVCGGGFDIVVNFAAQQWATDTLLDCLDQISATKVMVPTGFSGLPWKEYADYYRQMPGWLKHYDRLVFLGTECRDACFTREHGFEGRSVIIPNGAAAEEFLVDEVGDIRSALDIPQDHALILLVGAHTGLKGHAQAFRLFSKSRLRHATLLIVGSRISRPCGQECLQRQRSLRAKVDRLLFDQRCVVTELSRAQTIAAFKAADIFLFPSMIECSPIVLFECMASKTPFLVTDVGNSREIVSWTSGGEILPGEIDDAGLCHVDIESGARALTDLWRNPDRRRSMAERGFTAWQQRFTWEKVASQYELLYEQLRN